MNIKEEQLAQKYAQAFWSVYYKTLSIDSYKDISSFLTWLKKNTEFLFWLDFSLIPQTVRQKALIDSMEHYTLAKSLQTLTNLLLEHQRIALLPSVLQALNIILLTKNNTAVWHITSAYTLSEAQKDAFKKFIITKTGQNPLMQYHTDVSLIAGVRLQSDNYMWQYSIKENLDNAYQESM